MGWLVSQCPASLELCSQTLQEYIEDGIDGEFGKRFYHDWKERRLAGLPSQEPGVIIELYNSVLQFLSDVASSEHLCDLSWPVTEFSEAGGNKVLPHLQWNMPDHLAWLKKAVLSFQIPYLDLPPLRGRYFTFQYLLGSTLFSKMCLCSVGSVTNSCNLLWVFLFHSSLASCLPHDFSVCLTDCKFFPHSTTDPVSGGESAEKNLPKLENQNNWEL